MPDKDEAQVAENGEGETDPKAPLADGEEEEDIGDPVPNNLQAVLALCGIVGAIMVAMGIPSSEWVIAVGGFYWQGLFIYCAGEGFNDNGSGSASGEHDSDEGSVEIQVEEGFDAGCKRIDLENQGYTMIAALFISICLATNIFGFILAMLGSWVRDLDSKRKSYKLSLYLFIICILSNILSIVIYAGCFGEVVETDPLGPFTDPEDEWELGWSAEIILTGLVFQIITALCVGYGLLLLPIIEEVEEEEVGVEEEKKEEKK